MHFSRRQFVQLVGLTAAGLARGLALPRLARAAQSLSGDGGAGTTPDDVLHRLMEGNRRFVKGELAHPGRKPEDFAPLATGQRPVAVIVGCSDSRVPPEIRARVCLDAVWLGIELDTTANRAGGPRISTPMSTTSAWVVPTNENLMIAQHTLRLLGSATE